MKIENRSAVASESLRRDNDVKSCSQQGARADGMAYRRHARATHQHKQHLRRTTIVTSEGIIAH